MDERVPFVRELYGAITASVTMLHSVFLAVSGTAS